MMVGMMQSMIKTGAVMMVEEGLSCWHWVLTCIHHLAP